MIGISSVDTLAIAIVKSCQGFGIFCVELLFDHVVKYVSCDPCKELVSYCARDVSMTHDLLCAVFPRYYEHCPHPVTLAGMFEMGSAYLPLRTSRWQKFVENADNTARKVEEEVKEKLMSLANSACDFAKDERYGQSAIGCFVVENASRSSH